MINSKELQELTGLRRTQINHLAANGVITKVDRANRKHFFYSDLSIGQARIAKCLLDSLNLSTTQVREFLGQLDQSLIQSVATEPENRYLVYAKSKKGVETFVLKYKERSKAIKLELCRKFEFVLILNLDSRGSYK